jgi:hypothetical protein
MMGFFSQEGAPKKRDPRGFRGKKRAKLREVQAPFSAKARL